MAAVIDLGSSCCKAGLGGAGLSDAAHGPALVVPSVVGRAKYGTGCMLGAIQREVWIGHEIDGKEGILIQKQPIYRGLVENWDDAEHIFMHIFLNLRAPAERHELSVLLTEPVVNPKEHREKMVQMMFESLGVQRCALFSQPVMALYWSGRTTGLVLDSGDTSTSAVPIYDGFVLPHAVRCHSLGGRDVTAYVLRKLQESNAECEMLSKRSGFKIAEDIKERHGFVHCGAVDQSALKSEVDECTGTPAGRLGPLRLGEELHLGPEVLWRPEILGLEGDGVAEMVKQSVKLADADIRTELMCSIVLCGGSTLFPHFADRLAAELRADGDEGAGAMVTALPGRRWAAWQGAMMVAQVEHRFWIHLDDYDEIGPSIVHDRCP